jgi:hypothetical protein
MKPIWLVLPLALAIAAPAAAQGRGASTKAPAPAAKAPAPAAAAPVTIRTSVSKTAVWVGDRVTYVVEVECPPKVDILADDLAAERLTLKGLDLLGVDVERDTSVADRVTHRMRYHLAAYEPEAPALSVGAIPVRYYIRQPGMRPEDAVPAGEVTVPPLALSLRSTIPEASEAALRDSRAVQVQPSWVRLARPVGLALVLLAATPVALWVADLVRRARRKKAGVVRQSRKQRLAALEQIKALDVSSPGALREAYAQLDAWVRSNLQQSTGVAAAALTPAEIGATVSHPPRGMQMDQIQAVLLQCERAKYAPESPSADQWQTALLEAENAVGVH